MTKKRRYLTMKKIYKYIVTFKQEDVTVTVYIKNEKQLEEFIDDNAGKSMKIRKL